MTDKKSVSFSQYSEWEKCPLAWYNRYVLGLRGDSGIAAVFGTSMHETIQHWVSLLYGDTPDKAKLIDLNDYFKSRLKELAIAELIPKNLTTKEELIEYYFDGCKILDHVRKYGKDWFRKGLKLIGCEWPLEIEVGQHLEFHAYLDVVLFDKKNNMFIIYDFKTSKYGWKYQKKDTKKTDQLLLYKRFYSKQFNIPESNIQIKFIILKRKIEETSEWIQKHVAEFEPANSTRSVDRAHNRFQNFLNKAFDEHGEPNLENIIATPNDSNCKFCAYNNNVELCKFSFYLKNRKITNGDSTT